MDYVILMNLQSIKGIPRWLCGKESASAGEAGNTGSILGQKDPLEEEIATHASILSRKSYGQMSLAGYSLWGCKELDMTEYACMHAVKSSCI